MAVLGVPSLWCERGVFPCLCSEKYIGDAMSRTFSFAAGVGFNFNPFVCNRARLSVTNLLDTKHRICNTVKIKDYLHQYFTLSLLCLGCLKGSCKRTSPQRVKSWSSVNFVELFLEMKNVNVLNSFCTSEQGFWTQLRQILL